MVKFKCTLCGRCCSDPDIYITLTHKDIYRLYLKFNDISEVMSKISLILDPIEHTLVMPTVRLYDHNNIVSLKKDNSGKCIFLNSNNTCNIYEYRPLVCRSFPFTFSKENSWLRWGFSFKYSICEGIGKGDEISDDDLINLGTIVLSEINDFYSFVRDWNLLVFSKKVRDDLYTFISRIIAYFE